MKKFLFFNLILSIFALNSCNSYDISGQPEISSDPEKKVFSFLETDGQGTVDFTISNKGVTGELKIYKINLLDPKGKVLSNKLFTFQPPKTNSKGIVTDELAAVVNSGSFLNSTINPLCPIDKTTSKCKLNFDNHNTEFKVRVALNDAIAQTSVETGNFFLEICSNDPSKDGSTTCDSGSSFKILVVRRPKFPPKPTVFLDCRELSHQDKGITDYPISESKNYEKHYAIRSTVNLNASHTNVYNDQGNIDNPDFEKGKRYSFRYKWKYVENPTPYSEAAKLALCDYDENGQLKKDANGNCLIGTTKIENKWYDADKGGAFARFTPLIVTPDNISPKSSFQPADDCANILDGENGHQTHSNLAIWNNKCDEYENNDYFVQLQAKTIDNKTGLESEPITTYCAPKIIPPSRVMIQLRWEEGSISREAVGPKVDLDVHLIKKTSLEGR